MYSCQIKGYSIFYAYIRDLPSQGGSNGKESACQGRNHKRYRFDVWAGKIPWRRKWQPTPVILSLVPPIQEVTDSWTCTYINRAFASE